MIKYKHIIFIGFIFSIKVCFSQTLNATIKLPQTIEPDKEFTVEITVSKSNIHGFMKFSQTLPKNFTASKMDTQSGAFTFKDSVVKIIWLAPPVEDVYTFSYKLKAPADISNDVNFNAKIDYLTDIKHEIFSFENVVLKINTVNVKALPAKEVISEDTSTKKSKVKDDRSVADTAYSVQIGAYTTKPRLQGVKGLTTIKSDNGVTKYLTGNYKTYKEAVKRRDEMKANGFKDAYIVTIKNGKISE